MKTVFVMNGEQFPTMLAVAKELGRSRVYRKDFERFGITEVEANDVTEEEANDVTEEEAKEVTGVETFESPEKENKAEFVDENDVRKIYRENLGMESIFDWAYKVKAYTAEDVREVLIDIPMIDDEKIPTGSTRGDRMHLVRIMREFLYPGEERPKVGAKAFRGYSTDALVKLYKAVESADKEKDLDAMSENAKRRFVLKEFREAGIHHPSVLEA